MGHGVVGGLVVMAFLSVGCGNQAESVVSGDATTELVEEPSALDDAESDSGSSDVSDNGASVSRNEVDSVADDSAPRLDPQDFCAVAPSGGPIDAGDVLIEAAGGRWGDDPFDFDTGRGVSGIDPNPPERKLCRHDDVAQDCTALLMFISEVGGDARGSVSDRLRGHELDIFASDVGGEASSFAATYRDLHTLCPEVTIEGDTVTISPLASTEVDALDIDVDGETLWLAAMAREKILSMVMVLADEDDPLRESDLSDFERLVELSQVQLEAAPAG